MIDSTEFVKLPTRPILILFDRNFNEDRGLKIAMDTVHELISANKDNETYFVYGDSERLNWHVEQYAYQFRYKEGRIIPFKYSKKDGIQASKDFRTLIGYNPSVVYIFRDNPEGSYSKMFINDCVKLNVKVICINSNGEQWIDTKLSRTNTTTKYYKERV